MEAGLLVTDRSVRLCGPLEPLHANDSSWKSTVRANGSVQPAYAAGVDVEVALIWGRKPGQGEGWNRGHGDSGGLGRLLVGTQNGGGASNFSRGHALIRNLRQAFSSLTATVASPLRLASA